MRPWRVWLVYGIVAAVLAVIALFKGLARSGKGIAPVVFAGYSA